MNIYDLSFQLVQQRNIELFAKVFLGIDCFHHEGQLRWFKNACPPNPKDQKIINILRPGNQWGKSLALAIAHIFHAITKIQLWSRISSSIVPWGNAEYLTLNFGKEYEVAKEVFYLIQKLVQGEMIIPGGETNKSLLRDWAIVDARERPLPHIKWWNHSETLFRSYTDMGVAFKTKRLAFCSGDEVGDIPELNTFINGTLLPRIMFLKGSIWLVGTPQARQIAVNEYRELIETAKANPKFYYVQGGSCYENPFLPHEFVRQIEATADPEMRRQLIYGEFANIGEKYFTYEEISHLFNEKLPFDKETGVCQPPVKGGRYVVSVDFGASKFDQFSFSVIRYDLEPYLLVKHQTWRGHLVPPPMQYQIVRDVVEEYQQSGMGKVQLIFDSGGSGGKTADSFLSDLHGFPYPGPGRHYAVTKASSLSALKDLLNRGRQAVEIEGKIVDIEENWGGLKAPLIYELREEMGMYQLDDAKLRQDRVATLWMAAYWLELRRPRVIRKQAVDFDWLAQITR